jgi:hypothetical protein
MQCVSSLLLYVSLHALYLAQDMYVSSWFASPDRGLQVDAYENQGTTKVPDYVLRSTYMTAGLYYFGFTSAMNRTNAETGAAILDFLLTNGSETIFVVRNNVSPTHI